MILLLGFAFLSGLVTILAPCIWPLLPIILSSSIAGGGGHRRPLGITLGIMLSFMIFTLSISFLVRIFHIDPNILRIFAVIIIGLLGLTMVVPKLTEIFEQGISRFSSRFGVGGKSSDNGFKGGFITGLSLGIVWSPCAGPILASIATLAATGQVSLQVVFVTLSYVIGVGIPLFAFAYGGQRFITRSRLLNKYTGRIQQIFGVLMILTAFSIYTNYDKVLQLKLLDVFPQFSTTLNGFEGNSVVTKELNKLKGQDSGSDQELGSELFNTNTKAPEFSGITKWLNTDKPLTMSGLRGKVVLVDFWTYTCINCIRTLPHVTSWYDKYKDDAFVVVGVHTPEFAFEKETKNVEQAIEQYNINYPVAQDNDYLTWNAFQNQYWPAEYLIDAKGTIRRVHFGEGEYDLMEKAIQKLLLENGKTVSGGQSIIPDTTPKSQISPETYVGSSRMQYLMDQGRVGNGNQEFKLSSNISPDRFSLSGNWNVSDEYSTTSKNSVLEYNFNSKKVFLVMKPTFADSRVKVFVDGQAKESNFGKDVQNGIVDVSVDRLYELVNLSHSGNHLLRLEFDPGIQVYAFTFGD